MVDSFPLNGFSYFFCFYGLYSAPQPVDYWFFGFLVLEISKIMKNSIHFQTLPGSPSLTSKTLNLVYIFVWWATQGSGSFRFLNLLCRLHSLLTSPFGTAVTRFFLGIFGFRSVVIRSMTDKPICSSSLVLPLCSLRRSLASVLASGWCTRFLEMELCRCRRSGTRSTGMKSPSMLFGSLRLYRLQWRWR